MWMMIVGKIIMGFSWGFMNTTSGRAIEEFTPNDQYGFIITIYYFLNQVLKAAFIIILSKWMPEDYDIHGL
jgi:MFS family permease